MIVSCAAGLVISSGRIFAAGRYAPIAIEFLCGKPIGCLRFDSGRALVRFERTGAGDCKVPRSFLVVDGRGENQRVFSGTTTRTAPGPSQ